MDNLNGLKFNRRYNEWLNDATFFDYYTRLKEIAINSFEWINLPDTCDPRFLELLLFEFGYCLFFKHRYNDAFLTLQCAINGPLNMYRVPIKRRAFAVTGFNQECDDLNSVIIWNNFLRQPTSLTVELFAQRLTEIERAINVNVKAQKTPVLISGSQEQQRALKAIYEKYDGNTPVIFGDKSTRPDMLQVLNTSAPENYLNLTMMKNRIWNEAMTFLGVDNAYTDKKERMITDEIESNNEQLMIQRSVMLNARQQACDMINKLFAGQLPNGAVSVRYRKQGGDNNGKLYDGIEESMPSVNRS